MQLKMSKFCALMSSSMIRLLGLAGLVSLGGCSGNWGWYVVNPATETGRQNLAFLIDGLYYTVGLSVTAICISICLGLLVALPALSSRRAPKRLTAFMLNWYAPFPFWC